MTHFSFNGLVESSDWLLFRSIICIAAGVLMIIFPDTFLKTAVVAIGILLALYGVMAFLNSYKKTDKDATTHAILVSGIVSLVLGVVLILSPAFFMQAFIATLGVLLIGLAVLQLFEINLLRQHAPKTSAFNYLSPLLLMACGLMVVVNPQRIANVILIVCATGIIYSGLSDFIYVLRIKKASKTFTEREAIEEAQIVDEEYE
ncbi:MAG: DUF308 domain-containing protein [Candidatus Azobacteroides sp.]|nr:DUF308 domain-containing protein [Candidatus Azobacteroides sp.]